MDDYLFPDYVWDFGWYEMPPDEYEYEDDEYEEAA